MFTTKENLIVAVSFALTVISKPLIKSSFSIFVPLPLPFFKIILPLSYPIILSVSLIMFLNTWSQFQIPLILASSMDTKPMAIVVSEFVTKDSVEYGLIATAGIISLIPPAVTAIIFRKYLISGMVGGSVKG